MKKIEELTQLERDEILESYYNDYPDNQIYSIDELDEIFYGQSVQWIVNRFYYGDYKPLDGYFIIDGCGNIQTLNDFRKHELENDYIQDYLTDY